MINIDDIIRYLKSRTKLLLGLLVSVLVGTIFYLFSITSMFKSEGLVKIVDELNTNQSPISSLQPLSFGLLNNSGPDKMFYVLEKLKSRSFFEEILQEDFLLAVLAEQTNLNIDPGKSLSEKKLEILYAQHLNNLDLYYDTKTGFLKIAYVSPSSKTSKNTIINSISLLNANEREKDKTKSQNSIKYLLDESRNTSNIDLKESFFEVIQSSIEVDTLSSTREDYLLEFIDLPYEESSPSYPNKKQLFFIINFVLFFLLLSLVILFDLILSPIITRYRELS